MLKPYLAIISAALALGLPADINCGTDPKPPVLPVTGGPTNLPSPPSDVKLLKIALGFGIQNYTCPTVGAAASATGALAMLYDVTNLYPGQNRRSLSQKDWDKLESLAMWSHNVPLNFNQSTAGRVDPKSPGASLTNPFTADAPLNLKNMKPLPFLGHHLFTADGVPNFILKSANINMLCTKLDSIDAPANADKGRQGTGAVQWLRLGAKDGSGSVGAKYVYRVSTVGGASHGCAKVAGQDSTSYTAMYWFYG